MQLTSKIYEVLKRQTASTKFIPAIDGLRFLAIWVVVADHLHGFIRTKIPYSYTTPYSEYMWFYRFLDSQGLKGVLLFFMISGFILGMPFAKHYWQKEKPVELKKYFLRRLTRLEPPYILNILFCFLVIMFFNGHDFAQSFFHSTISLTTNFLSSLAYLHYVLFPNTFSVNPVTWSLELEIQFYILVPILVLIFRLSKIYRRTLLIAVILLLPFLQEYFSQVANSAIRPQNFIYNYLQYFLLGFLLLDVYLSGFKLKLNTFFSFLLGTIVLFGFFYYQTYETRHLDYLMLIFNFGLGVVALTNDLWTKIFSWKVFTSIGGMCYSIYLWHNLAVSVVANKTINHNISHAYIPTVLWQFLLVMPAVLIVSTAMYLLIEKPCMDREWPKKLWQYFKVKILRSQTI